MARQKASSESSAAQSYQKEIWGADTWHDTDSVNKSLGIRDTLATKALDIFNVHSTPSAIPASEQIASVIPEEVPLETSDEQEQEAHTTVDGSDDEAAVKAVEEPSHENHTTIDLPKTFEEIRHLPGLTVEQWAAGARRPMLQERNPRDDVFYSDPQNVREYEARMVKFTDDHKKKNPYPSGRGNTSGHFGWMQHDSEAFVRDRVENASTDAPSSRIYFNPPMDRMWDVYEEIYTRAEDKGLRFKAKNLDFLMRAYKGDVSKEDPWLQKLANEGYSHQRRDPMVFYGFEDSTEELYEIARDVYAKYADDFEGRELGGIPCQIAPGFGVGEEPKGFSGRESLTSHREKFKDAVEQKLIQDIGEDKWQAQSADKKQQLLAVAMRNVAPKFDINPDNVAFGTR